MESKALALGGMESKALALKGMESKALALGGMESKALALGGMESKALALVALKLKLWTPIKKIKGENAAPLSAIVVMFELDYDNGFAHKVQSLVECQLLNQDEQY